jgi:hypothetical protein
LNWYGAGPGQRLALHGRRAHLVEMRLAADLEAVLTLGDDVQQVWVCPREVEHNLVIIDYLNVLNRRVEEGAPAVDDVLRAHLLASEDDIFRCELTVAALELHALAQLEATDLVASSNCHSVAS